VTWTRLSDDYADKPIMLRVSRSARLLDVEALVYCNKHTQDGALDAGALRRITDSPNPEGDAAELVAAGIWETTATGWQLDWSDQEPAEAVEARREEWRRRDERRRHHNAGDHSLCDPKRCHYLLEHPDALTRESRRESPPPVPSPTPVPDPPEGEGEGDEGRSADAPDLAAEGENDPPASPEDVEELQALKAQWAAQRQEKQRRRLSPVRKDAS
jgi:hypothetical protein